MAFIQKILRLGIAVILVPVSLNAQFTVSNVELPAELNNQVSISGIRFMDGRLYLASERCPEVFVCDPSGAVREVIHTQVAENFEMEAITSYKGQLYLMSENKVAVYALDPSGKTTPVSVSMELPNKNKDGDGMEGIAGNEKNEKFYLLHERTNDKTKSEIFTFAVQHSGNSISLKYESTIDLPLETSQWRYSDICYDAANNRLLCLKSFAKGKMRQQFIESLNIDNAGNLDRASLKNVPVQNFSEASNAYKDKGYSMNLEGITVDAAGNIFVVSDNTSGSTKCDRPAKEKTVMLKLSKS